MYHIPFRIKKEENNHQKMCDKSAKNLKAVFYYCTGEKELRLRWKEEYHGAALWLQSPLDWCVCLAVTGAGHAEIAGREGMNGIDYTRYNKPLIWWSICSRTSSSIIHPPVRHHLGSRAAKEPDRVNSFKKCISWLSAYASINLSISVHCPAKQDLLLSEQMLFCWWRLGCLWWYLT